MSEKLYTAQQVRALDRATIQAQGIASYELMERAGRAAFQAALRAFPGAGHWLVLCGGGNNGGDGYVVARLARQAGLEVSLVALRPADTLDGDAARAADDWRNAGGATALWPSEWPATVDLVVDALLGTGLDRPVEGEYAAAIGAANQLRCPRLAVDTPSGLNADTGRVMGIAVAADLTVSFVGRKRGLYTADGPGCAGERQFHGLGAVTDTDLPGEAPGELLERNFLASIFQPRPLNSHKGDFGHVLVVGGQAGMGGAARLAGEAALRSGAGLVSLATHPAHAHWLNLARPELMTLPMAAAEDLAPGLERATVLAVGPGLGTDAWAQALVDAALRHPVAKVIDADALNLLAAKPREVEQAVLTPHPGEAGRLLDVASADIQADRVGAAREIARRFGAVCVLKGCGTVVSTPDGGWAICGPGNPGMATAGSGDVLTGVIAGLLAQGLSPRDAARAGVVAHAAAGDLAAREGQRGLLASDISAQLPRVLNG